MGEGVKVLLKLEHQGLILIVWHRSEILIGETIERRIHQIIGFNEGWLDLRNIDQTGFQPVVALGFFKGLQSLQSDWWGCSPFEIFRMTTEPSCMATSRTSPSFISRSSMISLRGAM